MGLKRREVKSPVWKMCRGLSFPIAHVTVEKNSPEEVGMKRRSHSMLRVNTEVFSDRNSTLWVSFSSACISGLCHSECTHAAVDVVFAAAVHLSKVS